MWPTLNKYNFLLIVDKNTSINNIKKMKFMRIKKMFSIEIEITDTNGKYGIIMRKKYYNKLRKSIYIHVLLRHMYTFIITTDLQIN